MGFFVRKSGNIIGKDNFIHFQWMRRIQKPKNDLQMIDQNHARMCHQKYDNVCHRDIFLAEFFIIYNMRCGIDLWSFDFFIPFFPREKKRDMN